MKVYNTRYCMFSAFKCRPLSLNLIEDIRSR